MHKSCGFDGQSPENNRCISLRVIENFGMNKLWANKRIYQFKKLCKMINFDQVLKAGSVNVTLRKVTKLVFDPSTLKSDQ